MTNKKRLLFNILFFIFVFGFTMYKLSKETDSRVSLNQALSLNYWFILLGFLLIIIYVLSESVILYFLFAKIKKSISFLDCALYSFIGFLYSSITPSASGGQPAQMYYMKRRNKILVGESTPLLMIVTIAYKGVLVLIGAFIVIFNISDIKHYVKGAGIYIYIGLVANIVLLIFMIILLIRPEFLFSLSKALYKGFLARLLGKRKYVIRNRAVDYLNKYISTAIYYRGHYNNMALPVMGMTMLQRVSYFAVTIAVYKAFNLSGVSFLTILILSAVINVAIDMLPLPGGMGATELLFISLFSMIFGDNNIVTAMLINRFLTFYVLIILGIISVIIMNIRINRSKLKEVGNDRIL